MFVFTLISKRCKDWQKHYCGCTISPTRCQFNEIPREYKSASDKSIKHLIVLLSERKKKTKIWVPFEICFWQHIFGDSLHRDTAVFDEKEPGMLTHQEIAGCVQNSTLSFLSCVSRLLSVCLSNLKYSRITGCATWTQATCQGLSTCLATSTPCESWEVCCSEATALAYPLFSHISFHVSHFCAATAGITCGVWMLQCADFFRFVINLRCMLTLG